MHEVGLLDITPVVIAILTCLFGLITARLIPYIQSKISEKETENLRFWVEVAVNAAEQLCRSGVIQKDERKEQVLKFLQEKDLILDIDKVEALIESYVGKLPSLIVKDTEKDE